MTAPVPHFEDKYLIDCKALKDLMDSQKVHLFDVRNPEEVATGMIKTAVNIPCESFLLFSNVQ